LPANVGNAALPHLTADVIRHIPDVATVGWATLGGIWWITNRRNAVAAAVRDQKEKEK
jgi:hypothetical protein